MDFFQKKKKKKLARAHMSSFSNNTNLIVGQVLCKIGMMKYVPMVLIMNLLTIKIRFHMSAIVKV